MTSFVAGDPASVSALAAELHRVSSALTSVRGVLERVHRDLDLRSGGAAADGARCELQAAGSRAATTTGALEECRRALQSYAADLQEARARALIVEETCRRRGLALRSDGSLAVPARAGAPGAGAVDVGGAVEVGVALEVGVAARAARDDAEDAARRLAARVAPAVAVLDRVVR